MPLVVRLRPSYLMSETSVTSPEATKTSLRHHHFKGRWSLASGPRFRISEQFDGAELEAYDFPMAHNAHCHADVGSSRVTGAIRRHVFDRELSRSTKGICQKIY
jgi:hypothetical protein